MSTTSRKFTERTKDPTADRVLDARTKALLNAIHQEPRGEAVKAYLRALAKSTDQVDRG